MSAAFASDCPKCGFKDIATSYHPRRSYCDPWSRFTFNASDEEHLHRTCRRCGYDWTDAVLPEHKHAWKMVMHLDGCHFYSSSYSCSCGATAATYSERDVKADPYSMVWMDDEGQDAPCKRCEELMAGAEPKHEHTITEAAA